MFQNADHVSAYLFENNGGNLCMQGGFVVLYHARQVDICLCQCYAVVFYCLLCYGSSLNLPFGSPGICGVTTENYPGDISQVV